MRSAKQLTLLTKPISRLPCPSLCQNNLETSLNNSLLSWGTSPPLADEPIRRRFATPSVILRSETEDPFDGPPQQMEFYDKQWILPGFP